MSFTPTNRLAHNRTVLASRYPPHSVFSLSCRAGQYTHALDQEIITGRQAAQLITWSVHSLLIDWVGQLCTRIHCGVSKTISSFNSLKHQSALMKLLFFRLEVSWLPPDFFSLCISRTVLHLQMSLSVALSLYLANLNLYFVVWVTGRFRMLLFLFLFCFFYTFLIIIITNFKSQFNVIQSNFFLTPVIQ